MSVQPRKQKAPAVSGTAADSPRAARSAARRTARRDMTLDDVAQLAGVAPITVSRALHKPHLVSPKTVEKVQAAVDRLGYVPNLLAGGLASQKSRLIMAVIPTTINPTFSEMVDALRDELVKAGYELMIGLSGYSDEREEELVNAIISRRPDGIVLAGLARAPTLRKRLTNARIPVVETWDLSTKPVDMLVGFSNRRVGRAAAEYFIDSGRHRLALLVGGDPRAAARSTGFQAAAKARGVPIGGIEVVPSPTTVGIGRAAIRRLLQHDPAIDAVFCSSDQLALGVLLEGIASGIAIPGRLAVMGFGNLNFSADTWPSLTTVAVDGERIGRQAARFLLDRIEGAQPDDAADKRILDVGFRIIRRDSA
jgi:LacI family gluconate utilization system Gnt-I transcriptional repressor